MPSLWARCARTCHCDRVSPVPLAFCSNRLLISLATSWSKKSELGGLLCMFPHNELAYNKLTLKGRKGVFLRMPHVSSAFLQGPGWEPVGEGATIALPFSKSGTQSPTAARPPVHQCFRQEPSPPPAVSSPEQTSQARQ